MANPKMKQMRRDSIDKQLDNETKTNMLAAKVFEKEKKNIPAILENKIQKIAGRLAEVKDGISPTEIYSIMRNDNFMGAKKKYTPEELGVLFESYTKIIEMINEKQTYPPTIKNFCSYIGISTNTYNEWLGSTDSNRKDIMQRIDDYISDMALSLAQIRKVDTIATMFRAKTEHKMVEAQAPTVIRHEESVSLDEIKEQLKALQNGQSLVEMKQGKDGVFRYEEEGNKQK